MNKIPLLFVLIISTLFSSAQLIITPAILPANGVQNVLAGSGVSFSNIQYTGNLNALGAFTTGPIPTGLGFPSGLVLSTGLVAHIADSSSHFASTNNVAGSDPQLAFLVSGQIKDAAVLEFDFVPSSDSVEFRFIFASEEYPEFVGGSYNDVFGFFISGPNPLVGEYANLNLATIPGTNLPVTINTINPNSNSSLYVNNSVSTSIVFDGMTHVLTAKALVTPCQTYHIKMAIGDGNDALFDSGVFLEASSFSSVGGSFNSGRVTGDTAICIGSIAPDLTLINNIWPVVRWESSVFPYTTWSPIADTATTYSPGVLTETTVFHAVVESPCSETSSMFAMVIVDSIPTPQFSYLASGLNVEFLNESTNATSYVWNFGSDTTTSMQSNPTYEYLLPGEYNVQLTAFNGLCAANYSQMITLIDESVAEISTSSFSVYPNPTKGNITIILENAANVDFSVIDIVGKIVYSKSASSVNGLIEMDLTALKAGIYILRMTNNQEVKQVKVTIQ